MTLDEHAHTAEAIRLRLRGLPRHSYLRDWVYGGIDGAVTTFAVVSGVAGAQLEPRIVLILGVANLLADGFSMAASNYLGTKAERGEAELLRRREEDHIDHYPEGEKEEVRQIYSAKGFRGDALEGAVRTITGDRERWIRTMLAEEYNLPTAIRSPGRAASNTFAAFCLCGAVPLTAYLFGIPSPFLVASLATGLVFFAIGSLKSIWTLARWWHSGLETFALGGTAAALAYLVGTWLGRLH